jgi:hypothetical protein
MGGKIFIMKKVILLFVLMLSGLAFVACQEKDLVLEFSGVDNKTIEYDEVFDIIKDVKVTGNDKKDYSDKITYATLSEVKEGTNLLNTKISGTVVINYSVTVVKGEKPFKANILRTITINAPKKTEFILNGDFSLGVTGWEPYSSAGTIELSNENGTLKAVIDKTSGQAYDPRISQMNIEFELGKTYEVTFRAKSDIDGKQLNLQVGELLPADPYFVDFKPRQKEERLLTTAWVNYSYKFNHTIDNRRGGLLFEFGLGDAATIWLDDIKAVVSTPDADTKAPDFEGVFPTRTIKTGTDFDPLSGVTAYDLGDGDVTENIEVVIYKIEGDTESSADEIDTSEVAQYKIVYTVKDSKDNEATATTILTIQDLLLSDVNLIANGDFANATDDTWQVYSSDNGTVLDVTGEDAKLTYTNGGQNFWDIQFNKAGISLEYGKSYMLTFDAKSTVARDITMMVASIVPEGQQSQDLIKARPTFALTADVKTFEFVFTVTKKPTESSKISFELGVMANFAAGTTTFDNVVLREVIEKPVLKNPGLDLVGWRTYTGDGILATRSYVNGVVRFDFKNTKALVNDYDIQVIQDKFAIGTGPDNTPYLQLVKGKTYRILLSARASVAGNVKVQISTATYHNFAVESTNATLSLTTEMQDFVVDFSLSETADDTQLAMFKIEFGKIFGDSEADQFFELDNVQLLVLEGTEYKNTNQIVNGTMTEVLDWSLAAVEGGTATMEMNDEGNLVIDVTEVGDQAHSVHIHNGEATTMSAGKYILMIRLSSNVARTARANIVDTKNNYGSVVGGFKDVELAKDDVEAVLELEFTLDTDFIERLKVEFDFGLLGGTTTSVPAEITIYEINLFKVY